MDTDTFKPQINTDEKLIYKELTREILNAAFEVHNTLGCGFLEKVYENALVSELKKRIIKFTAQKEIKVYYKSEEIGVYYADVTIEDKIILEIKTVEKIIKFHEAQLLNYLKASNYRVGMILNFANTKLEYKRLIL
jgi:GxxExxY protein